MHHAAFLLQHEDFEKVADRFRMADDVMHHRPPAERLAHVPRRLEDVELFFRARPVYDPRNS